MDDFGVYRPRRANLPLSHLNNAQQHSYIKVVKVDAETTASPSMRAQASRFTARTTPGGNDLHLSDAHHVDTFYTNAGLSCHPEAVWLRLLTGGSAGPYGYVLDNMCILDVEAEGQFTEEGTVMNSYWSPSPTWPKERYQGQQKPGESVHIRTEKRGAFVSRSYSDNLPDAVFEITAFGGRTSTLDGTLRYSAGEVVDTITTGRTGRPEPASFLYLRWTTPPPHEAMSPRAVRRAGLGFSSGRAGIGGQAGAQNGVLTVMCGGDQAAFDAAGPVLAG